MIDSLYMILLHVAFVSMSPLLNGVLDKDVSDRTLMANPSLYKPCQQSQVCLAHLSHQKVPFSLPTSSRWGFSVGR